MQNIFITCAWSIVEVGYGFPGGGAERRDQRWPSLSTWIVPGSHNEDWAKPVYDPVTLEALPRFMS